MLAQKLLPMAVAGAGGNEKAEEGKGADDVFRFGEGGIAVGKKYDLYEGTVVNTGWPIDGRRLIFGLWDYDKRSSYHLFTWADKDDEAVMMTMFRTLVDGGFIDEVEKDEFIMVWKDGMFDEVYCPGPFCIELDKLVDVLQVEYEG